MEYELLRSLTSCFLCRTARAAAADATLSKVCSCSWGAPNFAFSLARIVTAFLALRQLPILMKSSQVLLRHRLSVVQRQQVCPPVGSHFHHHHSLRDESSRRKRLSQAFAVGEWWLYLPVELKLVSCAGVALCRYMLPCCHRSLTGCLQQRARGPLWCVAASRCEQF
jgi:hypothetical protein